MTPVLVNGCFGPRKEEAVVAGHEDESILEFRALLEQRNHLSEIIIETLNLESVVKHVRTYFFTIVHVCGNIQILQPLPVPKSGPFLVGPVWFLRAVPETERLVVGLPFQRIPEVSRVVVAVHA